jgi:hypothetical protein
MRRKEKEIAEREVLEEILHKAPVCHLAMSDQDHLTLSLTCYKTTSVLSLRPGREKTGYPQEE